MKTTIRILVIITVLCTTHWVYAAEWEGSVRTYKTIPSDPDSKVQSGYGLQANIHLNDWYLYISQDTNPIRFGGQGGQDVKLQSAGFGFTHDISEYFSFFADIGWYHPEHDTSNQDTFTTTLSEGLYLHLNKQLGMERTWQYYTIEYHGAIGGKLGFEFNKPISENWSISLSTAYRYLQLGEMIKGKDYDWLDGWWEYKEDRDFGGWQAGMALTYRF